MKLIGVTMIDIVIPIYNAFDELKDCLKSVENNLEKYIRVILINDASTDERIDSYLKKKAEINAWLYIKHEVNQGFVKTANEGLRLSGDHTILLNSDTIVTRNWLKAFERAIVSVGNLGTATPWSNNAEICSFPCFLKNQPVPQNLDEISETIFESHQPEYPEIPTAVGFCMLITSLAKEKVGYFDEEHFGLGYGEENDYSLRISKAGLLNVLCDNAYVAHIGNKSFSDLGLKPNESTMQRLLQKHPDFLLKIQRYIENDSLSGLREKLLQRINNSVYKF